MAPIFDQVIRLLSSPEGNLIYSLVLGLCSLAALIACLYAGSNQVSQVGKRMQLGLVILLIAQLVHIGVAWLVWLGMISETSYLPPLDRMLALFSLVLIIWLWAFPEPHPVADLIATVASSVIVLFGVGNLVIWLGQSSNTFFNASAWGGYAYYAGVILLVVGVILLVIRKPTYWGYGLLMQLIMLAGYIGQHAFGKTDADYDWYIHLGEMASYLLLLTLPLRLLELKQAKEVIEKAKGTQTGPSNAHTRLIQSITSLLTLTAPQQYYQEIIRSTALLMRADFCLLMMPPKTGDQIIVPVGYNRLEDRMIDGFTTQGIKMPLILEALKGRKSVLSSKDLEPEVQSLGSELGISLGMNFMMTPFHPKGANVVMAMAVLARTSSKIWKDEDASQLIEIGDELVSSAGQYTKGVQPAEQADLQQKLQQAQAYTDQVRLEYAQLKAKYDSVSAHAAVAPPIAIEMAALVEGQTSLQDKVKQLEARNRELENLLGKGRPSMEEVEQLRQELRLALADLARIPSTLSKSDQRMLELQLSTVKRLDEMQPTELVNSIAQDIRQPLSSIIGYTDLLLGESVGLLGAVQKKFVERVKAAAERLGILLNELVQVISIDAGKVEQTTMSVDLKTVVDEALSNIDAQIGEKNIDMRVELPEQPIIIQGNKDAVLQILENLLQNACLATPVDGWIRLLASVEQKENEPKYIHIAVTDQGGGIEKMDISRVFQRRYKMENPLIQGVGDTGVGLSIVKSLVELSRGRVWVESKEGVGSTFSVLLPLTEDQSSKEVSKAPAG